MNKVLIVFALMSLIACAPNKGTDAVDGSGNCTQAAIDSYNNVIYKARSYGKTGAIEDLKEVSNSCKGFQSFITGQSCKATSETGEAMTLSYDVLKPKCDLADSLLSIKPSSEEQTKTDDSQKQSDKRPTRRSRK